MYLFINLFASLLSATLSFTSYQNYCTKFRFIYFFANLMQTCYGINADQRVTRYQ